MVSLGGGLGVDPSGDLVRCFGQALVGAIALCPCDHVRSSALWTLREFLEGAEQDTLC